MKETRVNKYSEYRSSFSKSEEASFITPSNPTIETSLSSSQRLFLQNVDKRRNRNIVMLVAIALILIGIIVGAIIVFWSIYL